MKSYLLSNWTMIASGFCVLAMAALLGCSALATRPATARLAVTYAVSKYIEGGDRPGERAQRVRDVATKVLAVAQGDSVTVDVLKVIAINQLPANLSPADRALAGAIIDVVVEELKLRVANGVLPADQLLTVRNVVQWVADAALPYLPQT
jgi:hypothetical protein